MRFARGFALVVCTSAVLAPAAHAQGPFEPNDSLAQAFGPLTGGTPYDAAFETAADEDWFFFYTPGPTQIELAARALSAPDGGACATLTLRDSAGENVSTASLGSSGVSRMTRSVPKADRYSIQMSRGCAGASYEFRIDPASALTATPPSQPAPTPAPPTPAPTPSPGGGRMQEPGPSAQCRRARALVRKYVRQVKRLRGTRRKAARRKLVAARRTARRTCP